MGKSAQGANETVNVGVGYGRGMGFSQTNINELKAQYTQAFEALAQQVQQNLDAIEAIVSSAGIPPEMVREVVQSLVSSWADSGGTINANLSGFVNRWMSLKPQH
jgi:NAD(P)-dependent dehydrogenase (short-subunit alcohol dehydrogenase family)